ncbi:hypothetical protein [Desulfovibrio sp. MES5]|nr:hypothetical protein [Desulfovibrio sp. MES5]
MARSSEKTSIIPKPANAGNRHKTIWMRLAVPQDVERRSPVTNRR